MFFGDASLALPAQQAPSARWIVEVCFWSSQQSCSAAAVLGTAAAACLAAVCQLYSEQPSTQHNRAAAQRGPEHPAAA